METKSEIVKLEINPDEYGLQKHEAEQIQSVFVPMLDKLKEYEDAYNNIVSQPISEKVCKDARELRLKLVKVRTGTADIHKKAKAYYLAGGRAVDGLKNTVTFAITGKEEELEKIEKYYENLEKERIAKLQEERAASLLPYDVDGSLMNLGQMTDDVWNNYFTGTKLAYQARIEAEQKAEQERIAKEKAEAEERERIRLENERLKKEAEEREAKMKAEREEAERKLAEERRIAEEQRLRIEEEARKEREEREKILAAERAKAEEERKKIEEENRKREAEQRAKIEAERKERERIEAELKAKKDAEEAAKKAEEAARKKAERAPDKTKLIALAKVISEIQLPDVKSEEANKIVSDVKILLDKVNSFITEKSKDL